MGVGLVTRKGTYLDYIKLTEQIGDMPQIGVVVEAGRERFSIGVLGGRGRSAASDRARPRGIDPLDRI